MYLLGRCWIKDTGANYLDEDRERRPTILMVALSSSGFIIQDHLGEGCGYTSLEVKHHLKAEAHGLLW